MRILGFFEVFVGLYFFILSFLLSSEYSRGFEYISGGRLFGIRGCGLGLFSRWSRVRTGVKDVI